MPDARGGADFTGRLSPPCPVTVRAEWPQPDFAPFQVSLNTLFLPVPFQRIRVYSAFAIRDLPLPQVHFSQRDHTINPTAFSRVTQTPSTPGSQDYRLILLTVVVAIVVSKRKAISFS